MNFQKYHGAGNDFILIDSRSGQGEPITSSKVRALCDRHRGVGGDGVILLDHSSCADYRMRIFNSDGSEPAMCGNGIRCLVLFARDLGDMRNELSIETGAGILTCRHVDGGIAVNLGPPKVLYWPIDCEEGKVFVVDTGVPHAVVFVDHLEKMPLIERGRAIRFHPQFGPQGVNVNFVSVRAPGDLALRTYERGVEGETQSCGTGAAAAAFVAAELLNFSSPVKVSSPFSENGEGDLYFHFYSQSNRGREIEMIGSACRLFSGTLPELLVLTE